MATSDSIGPNRDVIPSPLAAWKLVDEGWTDVLNRLAAKNIPAIHTIIENFADPDIGNFGKVFLERLGKSGCQSAVMPSKERNAFYDSYLYERDKDDKPKGFVNAIVMGYNDLHHPENMVSNIGHEGAHALQNMDSVDLQASPRNPNTRILYCPEDWVRLEIWCEAFAFLMQVMCNTALAQYADEGLSASATDPISVEDFRKLRKEHPKLKDAMLAAAKLAMQKSRNPGETFLDYYRDYALNVYEQKLNERKAAGENLTFVKLGNNAIYALRSIANAAIPDLFSTEDLAEFLTSMDKLIIKPLEYTFEFFKPEKKDQLDERCNTANKENLRTLERALAPQNLSLQEYLALSRANEPTYPVEPLPMITATLPPPTFPKLAVN